MSYVCYFWSSKARNIFKFMASCTATAIPQVQKIQLAKSKHFPLFHSLSVDRCRPEENVSSSKDRLWSLCSTEFKRDHKTCPIWHVVMYYFHRHLSKGMERGEERGKKRERNTLHFIYSIWRLKQLEPLFEKGFN